MESKCQNVTTESEDTHLCRQCTFFGESHTSELWVAGPVAGKLHSQAVLNDGLTGRVDEHLTLVAVTGTELLTGYHTPTSCAVANVHT